MKKNSIKVVLLFIIFVACNNVVRENGNKKEDTKIILESDFGESESYNGIKTCEEAQKLAKMDVSNGNLKYIFSSFGSRQQLPRNLKKLYGIEIITVDGVLGIPNKCYNDVMYKEIQKKFGKDAFNKAMD